MELEITKVQCRFCGHEWAPRKPLVPRRCKACGRRNPVIAAKG